MNRRDVIKASAVGVSTTLAGCGGIGGSGGDDETGGGGGFGGSDNSTPTPRPTPQTRLTRSFRRELEAGDLFTREYTLDQDGRIEYSFFLRDGEDASVYLMEPSEAVEARAENRFSYIDGAEDVATYDGSPALPQGDYTIVVANFDAVISSIEFELDVEVIW